MGVDTFNLISYGQYRSVSNIQVIKNYPMIPLDYDYILNLQTIDKLSSTFNIYLNKIDLDNITKCLEEIINNSENYTQKIEYTCTNYLSSSVNVYYRFIKLIRNKLLYNIIFIFGAKLVLDLSFKKEDDRFIYMNGKVSIFKFFRFKPKEVQPTTIVFSKAEAKNLIRTLKII